jgi:hypothetical protein
MKGKLVKFTKSQGNPGFGHDIAKLKEGDLGIYLSEEDSTKNWDNQAMHTIFWFVINKKISNYDSEFEKIT